MISFVPTPVEALPAAALNADAAGAVATEGAGAFGNVLEQLMGAASGKGAAVDLPLEDEDEPRDEAELDELANANVVADLGAQPIIRLALAPTWALTDATATPVAVDAAVDSTVAERSVSAPTGKSQPLALDGVPIAAAPEPLATVNEPSATASEPSTFAALMPKAANTAAETLPEKTSLPEATNLPSPKDAAAATPPRATEGAAVPTPAASTPTVPPPAVASQPAQMAETPAPEMVARDLLPRPEVERRSAGKSDKTDKTDKSDKHDQGRPAFRVTAEAGQRAYAAAASESSAKDNTGRGMSDARGDARPGVEPATAATPAATPFQVVVERPAPAVGATVAGPVVVSAEAIETAVATELPAQVVQSIRMQAIDGGGEAIVRLNPEYLGELVVAVKVEQGAVSAALQSDVPAVRKWVEANEGSLRQALAEHGLQLDRLTVSGEAPQTETGERDSRHEDPHEEESQPESRRQRKKAPDATFEVVV